MGWWSTTTALPTTPSLSSRPFSSFVFGCSTSKPSTTLTAPSVTRWLSAARSAAARAFLGIEYE